MLSKETLINRITGELESDLAAEQLRKLKLVLTIQLDPFDVTKSSRDLVIYDETSDIAAYKQFFVSKKIQGLSDNTLTLYMRTINFFMKSVRKPYKDVTTNDIRLFIANREMMDRVSKGTIARERG